MNNGPSTTDIVKVLLEVDPHDPIAIILQDQDSWDSKPLWQSLLSRFFPFVVEKQEFHRKPSTLFKQLYFHYANLPNVHAFGMPTILAALSGDEKAIERAFIKWPAISDPDLRSNLSKIKPAFKKEVYALAVGNGHLHYFSRLTMQGKAAAFEEAIRNGYKAVVEQLLPHIQSEHIQALYAERVNTDPMAFAIEAAMNAHQTEVLHYLWFLKHKAPVMLHQFQRAEIASEPQKEFDLAKYFNYKPK